MVANYTIPAYGFEGVKIEIAKLNKKAIKLELKPIEINILKEYKYKFVDYGEMRYRDPAMIGTVDIREVANIISTIICGT